MTFRQNHRNFLQVELKNNCLERITTSDVALLKKKKMRYARIYIYSPKTII